LTQLAQHFWPPVRLSIQTWYERITVLSLLLVCIW
jgi:hypothetical protein